MHARRAKERKREREGKRQFAQRARGNIIRRRHVQHIVESPAGAGAARFCICTLRYAAGVGRFRRVQRNREWKREREKERERKKKNCRSIRGGEWNPTVEMACFIAFPKIYCREIATPGSIGVSIGRRGRKYWINNYYWLPVRDTAATLFLWQDIFVHPLASPPPRVYFILSRR